MTRAGVCTESSRSERKKRDKKKKKKTNGAEIRVKLFHPDILFLIYFFKSGFGGPGAAAELRLWCDLLAGISMTSIPPHRLDDAQNAEERQAARIAQRVGKGRKRKPRADEPTRSQTRWECWKERRRKTRPRAHTTVCYHHQHRVHIKSVCTQVRKQTRLRNSVLWLSVPYLVV